MAKGRTVPPQEVKFHVASGLDRISGKPIVHIRFEDNEYLIDPDQARMIGNSIVEASEASRTDAFLYAFIRDTITKGEPLDERESLAKAVLDEWRRIRYPQCDPTKSA